MSAIDDDPDIAAIVRARKTMLPESERVTWQVALARAGALLESVCEMTGRPEEAMEHVLQIMQARLDERRRKH